MNHEIEAKRLAMECAELLKMNPQATLPEAAQIILNHANLAELLADKARLDWLEATKSGSEFNDRIGEFTVQKYQQVCGCIGRSRNLRGAIDEALEVATLSRKAKE